MGEWDNARLPTNYNQAARAMAKLASLDECVEWKNKGTAMASYARQMNDTQLQQHAWEVKERAERRFGELSQGIKGKQGQRTDKQPVAKPATSSKKQTLEKVNVTQSVAHKAEQKAKIPDAEFEKHIENGKQRIAQGKPPVPAKPRYIKPSRVQEAVKDIIASTSFGQVDPSDRLHWFKEIEKAIKKLQRYAIDVRR